MKIIEILTEYDTYMSDDAYKNMQDNEKTDPENKKKRPDWLLNAYKQAKARRAKKKANESINCAIVFFVFIFFLVFKT